MKKTIYFLFFFSGLCFVFGNAQTTISDTITTINKQFEPNFQEKYTDAAFNYQENISSESVSAWERFWRAVGRFFDRLFSFGSKDSLSGLEILFKIIAFLIIGFVVYMIVKIIINKDGGWIFGKSNRKIDVSDLVEENIHTIDFQTIINNAKKEENYRICIRYYYLWVLKTLADKEIIEWDMEKTNADYVYEISDKKTKTDFQYLSYLYDYIWYGEFELQKNEFLKAEKSFLETIKK